LRFAIANTTRGHWVGLTREASDWPGKRRSRSDTLTECERQTPPICMIECEVEKEPVEYGAKRWLAQSDRI